MENKLENDKMFFSYLQALLEIPIILIDEAGELLYYLPESIKMAGESETLITFLMNECGQTPAVFQKEKIHFAGFCWQGCFYVIGPCSFEPVSFKERNDFGRSYGIQINELDIPLSNYQTLKNALLFLNYQITGRNGLEKEVWENYTLGKEKRKTELEEDVRFQYHVKYHENEKNHASYERERFYYEHIARGEKVSGYASQNTDTNVMERVGEMAKNMKKQYEYLAVSTVSMAARAAIEGGMISGQAYEISDLYLQRLEKCNTSAEMMKLCLDAMDAFAEAVASVHTMREQSADHVEKCKAYLFRNLKKKISLEEIAQEMGLNACYLSRIFSQKTGMSIIKYFQKEKLKLAANFLRYSEYSVSEIADYLSYSSQSKLGEAFKKEYHMTPLEYRKKFQVNDYT